MLSALTHFSLVGVDPFTQNDTPWFDMSLGGGILLNSCQLPLLVKTQRRVRLGHFRDSSKVYELGSF